jgi:uncharacterized protein YacL
MILEYFCAPAIIYFTFVLIHVLISTYNKKTNAAILQFLIGLLITLLLQLLCINGMNIISWILVFIPFIFYTYIMVILFYMFGVDPEENMKKYAVR